MALRYIFVDMNSYFASVEQELQPHLRNRAVAVAPVLAGSGTCIAASYEAKRYGVKTGTTVQDARRMCPGIIFVEARPDQYIKMHHKIVAAVESCFHVDAVLSIDEMVGTLSISEQCTPKATALAERVKHVIREQAGATLRCSIGVAPNRFLAKIAADFEKPDGLTIFDESDFREKLCSLALRDLPGIGKSMEERLRMAGISTVQQLLECSELDLERIWGGIVGKRWFLNLRGHDLAPVAHGKSSISQSHVLPPQLRTEDGAYAVLLRLIQKASARLRKSDHFALHFSVSVKYISGEQWKGSTKLLPSQDTMTILEHFFSLWAKKSIHGRSPIKVSCVLDNLAPTRAVTQPLFKENEHRVQLGKALDIVNGKYGTNTVFVAAMQQTRKAAPPRIAFGSIPETEDENLL